MNKSTHSTSINQTSSILFFQSKTDSFVQTDAFCCNSPKGRCLHVFKGSIDIPNEERCCPLCGGTMHKHSNSQHRIKHIPIGGGISEIHFEHTRYKYSNPQCNHTKMQLVPFKSANHMISTELELYIEDLLSSQKYTLKEIGRLTGVDRHTVKEIDLKRLRRLYTIDGNELKKPPNPGQIPSYR